MFSVLYYYSASLIYPYIGLAETDSSTVIIVGQSHKRAFTLSHILITSRGHNRKGSLKKYFEWGLEISYWGHTFLKKKKKKIGQREKR